MWPRLADVLALDGLRSAAAAVVPRHVPIVQPDSQRHALWGVVLTAPGQDGAIGQAEALGTDVHDASCSFDALCVVHDSGRLVRRAADEGAPSPQFLSY